MTTHELCAPRHLPSGSLPMISRLLDRLAPGMAAAIRWVREVPERSAQRRALAALDDRLLRDIGVSRAEADAETKRLHWRS